jgi:hypothetical protein
MDSLPAVLASGDLRELARRIARAHSSGRTFLLMARAHPIKTGLSPLIWQLLRDGILSAVAMNGAAIIHDFELALASRTSEDVGPGLDDGSFGMAQETGELLNRAAAIAAEEGRGLGEIVGREISRRRLKHRDQHLSVRLRGWGAGYGPRCNRRGYHPHSSQRRRGGDRQGDVRRFSPPEGGGWIAVTRRPFSTRSPLATRVGQGTLGRGR